MPYTAKLVIEGIILEPGKRVAYRLDPEVEEERCLTLVKKHWRMHNEGKVILKSIMIDGIVIFPRAQKEHMGVDGWL